EREKGKLKNLSVRAKQARGLFAGEIIRKKLTDVRDLKNIILSDYEYAKDLSSRTEWFFVR
ncbi:MAG: peroxide stress protein YaaA, partial [Proteobacteria bacterium]|nr:peroxide stress protein YaaA [Desulfobacula sp.]MBU4131760.1 peroxide stress protein YaaA [Pseudomonadota bacterium]